MASTPPQHPPKKRRRPALACTQCRRRKMRCDQNTPCNNCTKSRIAECIYPQAHPPAGRPARTPPTGARIVIPLARRTPDGPAELASRPVPDGTGTRSTSRLPPSKQMMSMASMTAPDINVLLSRIDDLERSVSALSRPGHDSHHRGDAHLFHDPPAVPRPSGPRFANQSSWMNHTSLYARVLRCVSQAQMDNIEFRQTINQCKALSRRIGDRLSSEVDAVSAAVRATIPGKAVADSLVDAYFYNFEGVFRVLHTPSFRAEYEAYWREPAASRELFVSQVQVCMVLGTMADPDPLRFGSAPSQWLLEARAWMERSSKAPKRMQPSFEELQLICLLYLAEANGTASERASWCDIGDLVRKAMALNLHRDPSHLGIVKQREAEMRRRLWATIMELNLLLSLQVAQPPLISPSDWDTRPPNAISDEELHSEHGDHVTDTQRKHAGSSVQSAFHQSFRLRLQAASRVNAAGAAYPYSEILRLHTDLVRARQRLKTDLANHHQDEADDHIRSYCAMADVLFARYFLALHLPLLGRSIRDPAFHFSRRACGTVAMEMLDLCGVSRADEIQADPSRYRHRLLFINGAGLFRNLAVQPIFAVLLELVTFAEEQLDNAGAIPACDEAQILRHAEFCQTWAEKRVGKGFDDVHSCSFIAACRAYAAALESAPFTKEDVEEAMVVAALESGKRCCEGLAEAAGRADAANVSIANGPVDPVISGMDCDVTWQGDLDMEGMDDFFGFDWTLPGDPGMQVMSN